MTNKLRVEEVVDNKYYVVQVSKWKESSTSEERRTALKILGPYSHAKARKMAQEFGPDVKKQIGETGKENIYWYHYSGKAIRLHLNK